MRFQLHLSNFTNKNPIDPMHHQTKLNRLQTNSFFDINHIQDIDKFGQISTLYLLRSMRIINRKQSFEEIVMN